MKAHHAEAGVNAGQGHRFTIELQQQEDFRFEVHFDKPSLAPLLTDEPAPLGGDAGPNPTRMLATAVANCLAASLLFAMRKFGNKPDPLRAVATLEVIRNAQARWRVGRIDVDLHLGCRASAVTNLERVLGQFEDFCIVTQSIRAAFPVTARVLDSEGAVLHGGVTAE